MDVIKEFTQELIEEGLSDNTIKNFVNQVKVYIKWYVESFGNTPSRLHRINILDYISYLKNSKNYDAKTINSKLSALAKYNAFLLDKNIQQEVVITKKDYMKLQTQYINPCNINKKEVEEFRQRVLEGSGLRDYSIVTILAYAGLRISECLKLTKMDVDIINKEIRVVQGKGKKQRIVFINDKIVNAVREYLKKHKGESKYLFPSRQSEKLHPSVINKMIKEYSDKITPHQLRHFFCTHALEEGYSCHEVADQAGHASLKTTSVYTNTSREKMKEK